MPYDAERLRKQAEEMIEKFYGYVTDVKIINVETQQQEILIKGTFKELGSGNLKDFSMRLDQTRRLLDFSIK